MVPLVFLAVSAVGNIVLDLLFVAVLRWGITGAAAATVISQYASGIGIAIYVAKKAPELLPKRGEMKLQKAVFREMRQFVGPDLPPAIGDEFRHSAWCRGW